MGSLVGLKVRKLEAPEQMRGMAVSPIPRAMARMVAVARPARALGSTTLRTVFQWFAPRAALASRRPFGTTRRATSPARAMMGTIVTDMATETASPDFAIPNSTISMT